MEQETQITSQEPVGNRHLRGMKRKKPRQMVASKRVKNAWNKTKTGLSLKSWVEANSSAEAKQWLKNKGKDAIRAAKVLREKNKGARIAAEKMAKKSGSGKTKKGKSNQEQTKKR